MPYRSQRGIWCVALIGWISALGYSSWLLLKHDLTGDVIGPAAGAHTWPADSLIPLAADRLNLLFFIHPMCPCSRASLAELELVLAQARSDPRLCVVATMPRGAPAEWHESASLQRAAALSQVEIITDWEGQEACRFGADCSGSVLCYDGRGRRLYAGGITVARGHAGANAGADRLRQILQGDATPTTKAIPVFGCQLCLPE